MPYDVGNDPYIDKATGILRNLPGISDQQRLDALEADIVFNEISIILDENAPQPEDFTPEFFLNLHEQLFGTLYDWAGQLRTVEVSKGTTSFARVQYLEASLHEVFAELEKDNYCQGTDHGTFTRRLAHYYSELNVLHPFREGNGRTIRTFLSLLAASLDWHITWDQMTASENITACVAAYGGDEDPLHIMLERLVVPY